MAQRGFVIYSVDTMTGKVQMQAIVTESKDGLSPADRAQDIATRLRLLPSEGRDLDFFVAEADANASNFELGVIENLGEQNGDDFVQAARLMLERFGVVKIPLWLSASWVSDELRERHGLSTRKDIREGLLCLDLRLSKQRQAPEEEGFRETEGF